MASHRQVHFGPPVIRQNLHIAVETPQTTNMDEDDSQSSTRGSNHPEHQEPAVHVNGEDNQTSAWGWISLFRSKTRKTRRDEEGTVSDADSHDEQQAQAGDEDDWTRAPNDNALVRLDTQSNGLVAGSNTDNHDEHQTHPTNDWRKAEEQINYNRQFNAMLEPNITYAKSGWAAVCKTSSSLTEGGEPKTTFWSTSTDTMFIVLFLQPFTTEKQADTLPKLAEHLLEDCYAVQEFRLAVLATTDAITANFEIPKVFQLMLNYFYVMGRKVNLQGSITEKEQVFVDFWAAQEIKNGEFVEVDIEKSLEVGRFEKKTGWINRGATATTQQGLDKQTSPVKVPIRKVKASDEAWVVNGHKPWPE